MGSIIFGLWLIIVAEVKPLGIMLVCWGIVECAYVFGLKKKVDDFSKIVHKLHRAMVMYIIATTPSIVDKVLEDKRFDKDFQNYIKDIDTEIDEMMMKARKGETNEKVKSEEN